MKQVCGGCGTIIGQGYCYGCGTENGVASAKDEAYAEYLELVEEGRSITEARRQDCLRNGSERFREWNRTDDANTRGIQVALKKYNGLCGNT